MDVERRWTRSASSSTAISSCWQAFPDRLGPQLEAPEPIVWIDFRMRSGPDRYQIVSVVRMVEEPSGVTNVTLTIKGWTG